MNRPNPIPLRPDYTATRDAAVASLVRACIATGLATLDRETRPSDHARAWADDRALGLILRAAVSPATIASTPQLASVAASFLATLVPMSAGADLLGRCIGLNFAGAAQIRVPGIAVPSADFVAEGAAIPVVKALTSPGPTLDPHKLAVITSLSGEMLRNSNAETLVRQVLIESTGPAIDRVLFSNAAAGSDRPAGLLNGIAPIAAAAAGQSKGEVLIDDLQKLATAIAPVAGNGQIVLVASSDAGVALVLRVTRSVEWPILISASLPARTVIAIATNAIVCAVEGSPSIDASQEAEVHMETGPAEIVGSGSPAVVATPVASMYQIDSVALRLRWPISWALRSSAGLAWMENVNW
jgi:hypothetical protein